MGLDSLGSAFERAERAHAEDLENGFYAAVAESVWWATAVDEAMWKLDVLGDSYVNVREDSDDGKLLPGIRYARNRQVHDLEVTGMQGNPLLGSPASDARNFWLWRHLDDPGVPSYSPKEGVWEKHGESVYVSYLAGTPIIDSLHRVKSFLSIVMSV